MVLLLHEVETLRTFVIESFRSADKWRGNDNELLPAGTKRPMQTALAGLVREGIITNDESEDVQRIIDIRNKVGHALYELVADISAPEFVPELDPRYDYSALERFEKYRDKIVKGMTKRFVTVLDLRNLVFEQADATYKDELKRLRKRIDKQYVTRRAAIAARASAVRV